MLLSNGCCYQTDVVTKPVFLPNGFCYQTDSVNNQVLLKPGLNQTDCPYVMSCWLMSNSIRTDIQMVEDVPSNHDDDKLPVLDLKVWKVETEREGGGNQYVY